MVTEKHLSTPNIRCNTQSYASFSHIVFNNQPLIIQTMDYLFSINYLKFGPMPGYFELSSSDSSFLFVRL